MIWQLFRKNSIKQIEVKGPKQRIVKGLIVEAAPGKKKPKEANGPEIAKKTEKAALIVKRPKEAGVTGGAKRTEKLALAAGNLRGGGDTEEQVPVET